VVRQLEVLVKMTLGSFLIIAIGVLCVLVPLSIVEWKNAVADDKDERSPFFLHVTIIQLLAVAISFYCSYWLISLTCVIIQCAISHIVLKKIDGVGLCINKIHGLRTDHATRLVSAVCLTLAVAPLLAHII